MDTQSTSSYWMGMPFTSQKINPPLLIAREEAAKQLGVSLRTLDALIASGDLPIVRFGRSVRIRPSALDYLVESRETSKSPRARR